MANDAEKDTEKTEQSSVLRDLFINGGILVAIAVLFLGIASIFSSDLRGWANDFIGNNFGTENQVLFQVLLNKVMGFLGSDVPFPNAIKDHLLNLSPDEAAAKLVEKGFSATVAKTLTRDPAGFKSFLEMMEAEKISFATQSDLSLDKIITANTVEAFIKSDKMSVQYKQNVFEALHNEITGGMTPQGTDAKTSDVAQAFLTALKELSVKPDGAAKSRLRQLKEAHPEITGKIANIIKQQISNPARMIGFMALYPGILRDLDLKVTPAGDAPPSQDEAVPPVRVEAATPPDRDERGEEIAETAIDEGFMRMFGKYANLKAIDASKTNMDVIFTALGKLNEAQQAQVIKLVGNIATATQGTGNPAQVLVGQLPTFLKDPVLQDPKILGALADIMKGVSLPPAKMLGDTVDQKTLDMLKPLKAILGNAENLALLRDTLKTVSDKDVKTIVGMLGGNFGTKDMQGLLPIAYRNKGAFTKLSGLKTDDPKMKAHLGNLKHATDFITQGKFSEADIKTLSTLLEVKDFSIGKMAAIAGRVSGAFKTNRAEKITALTTFFQHFQTTVPGKENAFLYGEKAHNTISVIKGMGEGGIKMLTSPEVAALAGVLSGFISHPEKSGDEKKVTCPSLPLVPEVTLPAGCPAR